MGTDFLRLEEELSAQERAIRNLFRKFVDEEVLPFIGEWWIQGIFPKELISKLAALGALGAPLPKKYGGQELGAVAYGLMLQELERGDSGVRSAASVQTSLVMYPIFRYGSEAQREYFLPKMAKGELIGCFGLTEPEAGSDPASMKTTCEWTGSEWILRGSKMWITNGSIADVSVVWARDLKDNEIRGFLVEKGTPGHRPFEVKGKMSLRASDTSGFYLDDVRVDEAHRLPEGNGLRAPLSCLTEARYGIAWGAIGAATACYEEALTYAKARIQFHKPIASFQLIQNYLVEMLTEITKAQWVAYRVGRLKEQKKHDYTMVSFIKRNNVRMALQCARTARAILGATGITNEYASMRHAANLESVYTYEGTHEIQTLILGREITGISAFSE